MLLALLSTVFAAAPPALYALKVEKASCSVVERSPPSWKPKVVVQLKACEPNRFQWSPDGRRALVERPQPVLVEVASRRATPLPAPPGEADGFAFGKDGRVYAFSVDKAHGRGVLSVLEGGRYREVESISLARHGQEPWGSFLSNDWVSSLKAFQDLAFSVNTEPSEAPTQEEAKLLSSFQAEGPGWRVVRSGGTTLAYESCGTDACFGACTPVVVLREKKAIKLPLGQGEPDECLSVQAGRDFVVVTRPAGAFVFDAKTGALLFAAPPDEKNARLPEP
ncbi:MAG: hypothetical protein QM765_28410 [Myxococcales bacterium]